MGERINIHAPWTTDGCVQALDGTAGGAVLDRRGFLILGVGAAASLADQWLRIDPPQLVSVLRGGHIDAELVTCLEQRLPALRQMDAALGGGHIRNVVDAELRLVTDLLAKGTYTERLGKRAYSVAAELGRVAGWTSFDAGYHAAAERYWVAALRAAHAANDRALGANILKCMSLQRVDSDCSDEALTLAQAAREGAKDAPARVVAMLTVRQARTHAVRKEARECERLLGVAEKAMGQADEGTTPAWASYFDQAEYCAQVAACYLALERRETADYWLAQSLAMQPKERRRDRATYLIWRADSVLGLGDVEHACDLVSRAVPDIAAARSVRNKNRLTGIHAKIKKHQHPAVVALDEQIHSLIA
ncbi:transcriptional regulator [Micromonospora sp. WMMA1363]|uniref:transcriptional regulator n=1 Tax=Micromonospora sp. WMMA1363 TaxID=3053985 RepID=UPI00259D0A36|nr:transcriptional regulator [Micromonospora sp. WMMA1363]MDM4721374.1 transcriptional regulator [Micromonospora sp. WMMA1363]